MNNIYVEKMPKGATEYGCVNCPYAEVLGINHYIINGQTVVHRDCVCNLDKTYGFRQGEKHCPLKLLSDRLAEERKRVVQDLKNWCDKNFNWVGDGTGYDGQEYNEMIGSNNTINKLRELLDQIENKRGE